MKKLLLLASVLGTLLLTGCATVFDGGRDTVKIDTTPHGAAVYVDGKKMGVTPLNMAVEREAFNKKNIKVVLKGFETEQFEMKKTLNKVALFNLAGILSWGTDAATGNVITYAPNSYMIDLIKKQ